MTTTLTWLTESAPVKTATMDVKTERVTRYKGLQTADQQ